MPALTVSEIVAICGGSLRGDGMRTVTGANTVEEAGPPDVAFVANPKVAAAAHTSRAGCLIVPSGFADELSCSLVLVAHPRAAFAQVLEQLYPPRTPSPGVHPSAVVHQLARLGEGVYVGPFAVIGANAEIGDGCVIGQHSSVGEDVRLGPKCHLYPHVVLYPNVQVGARCILHSGVVIGADGFGFAFADGSYRKFPQVGTVVVGDDVELGANTCVDRAALGATVIGNGAKLDNMVHIAHNCRVGNHVVIAAQTGFSGGVEIGDFAVIGGQVGMGDRATVAPHAVVGSQAGILPGKHVERGEPVWGTPARPLRQHLKGLAHIARLPKYQEDLRRLKQKAEGKMESASAETLSGKRSG